MPYGRYAAGEADALYQLYEKHSQDRERGDRAIAETLLRSAAEKGHAESRYRIAKRTLSQPRTAYSESVNMLNYSRNDTTGYRDSKNDKHCDDCYDH